MENQIQNNNEGVKHHSKTYRLIKVLLWALLVAVILKSFFVEAYKIPTSSMEKTLLAGDFIFVNKASYSLSLPRTFPVIETKIPGYTFLSYLKPSRGDVVVFVFSENWNENMKRINYVKRIVGEPRDTVEIVDKVVYVNGRKFLEDKINLDLKTKDADAGKKIFSGDNFWKGKNMPPFIIPWKGLTVEVNSKNINQIGILINREYERNVISVEGTVINIDGKPARTYTFQQDHYFVMGDNRDISMDSRHWGTIPMNLITGKALMIYWSLDPHFSFLNSIRFERLFQIIK
jgi:signal peptidase I